MQYECRILTEADAQAWDAFVVAHPFGQALATSEACRFWRSQNWLLEAVGVFGGGALVGVAAVVTKKLGPLPWSLARIVALMPAALDIPGISARLLQAVHTMARSRRAVEIESRCRIPVPETCGNREYYDGIHEALIAARYPQTKMFRGTYVVRIDQDDEALLSSYSSKCRRDARKGLREGVLVVNLARPEDARMFFDALNQMCERKGLHPHAAGLFDSYWPMIEKGYFRLFGASHKDQMCNMALVEALGIPRYTLGATLPAAFAKGTPPTGQVLHYVIMRWFRDQGVRFYDLGGSPGPVPEEGHPNYTVWRFKHEFGGPFVNMMPSHLQRLSTVGGLIPKVLRRFGRLQL